MLRSRMAIDPWKFCDINVSLYSCFSMVVNVIKKSQFALWHVVENDRLLVKSALFGYTDINFSFRIYFLFNFSNVK